MRGKNKDLTNKERLDLLEKRYKKKEISKETYESLKKELMEKEAQPMVVSTPSQGTSTQLSHNERLKLLEERHKKGEISDKTYNELKSELTGEKAAFAEPTPPPATGMPPPSKAKKLPILPVIIVIAVVGIIIAAVALSGVMSGGEKDSNKDEDEAGSGGVTKWEDTETIDGSIAAGGPMTVMPNEEVDFQVEDTVVQMDITLTWDPQSMDLDLEIFDPDGASKGSSGNAPGEPESIRIKGKNLKPGTWTASIDPFAAVNVQYTLEILYYHESGNATGGEGDMLYQQIKTLSGESGDETDTFDVGEEYESLLIQVEISSGAGSMTLDIEDPEGEVVYSVEVSGEDQVTDQKTEDAKEGEWKVNYSFEEFTGTIVIQVIGT